ncbi:MULTISPECIES: LysR family transcriptional regulator [Roseobacteraceae]|jgi:DNA-binding transcriptional LysR family regulator|uniref:Transcriptional regulatory protein n=1 Tax=Celeribacter baekdonensis B30 TaxID=1208323 RepID=K2K5U8_9RHOB|nr:MULTISPECIES: LysR family transcriptional regulator [Roseobacteraceae]EKE72830.1 transcriptional regulatory protein [Celeribacter baekdonensis B30]KAB6717917.1 LysR family transcriptional regulator [Roseobacter sp. TSBP12]|tara:strand:+ start:4760 stop:5725 length:966 start_codon:yes stop_codon:yes gene_type:complete
MTDWDSLRYILAVAREGGLSGAARVLGVNHATVSRQLAKAEDTAGVRFFTRLASGLQPTEAGQVAIAHAEEVEARMVALDMALAARDETEEGELKVTIPPLLADNHFAQDLKTFKELHPAIDLQIVGATEVLNLHRREADVAIRVTQSPEESLWGRMMSSQRAGWFAAPSFIEQYKDVIEGRDTETHLPYIAFLAWAQTNPTALFADLPSCRVAMRTDDMITAMALARQGVGMVRTAHFLGDSDPHLVRVPGLKLTDHTPLWVLTHPDLRHVPRVTEFMRFIAGRFTARRGYYMGPDASSADTVIRPDGAKFEGTVSEAAE